MKDGLRRVLSAETRERLGYRWNRIRAAFLPEPYRTVMPYTMVDLPRLKNLRLLARRIDELGVPGDIVECGTCNGGSGALLASAAVKSPQRRHVWLLDSFEGLPPPSRFDGREAEGYAGTCRGREDAVRTVLRRSDVPLEIVSIVRGWFQDTLPSLGVEKIALLHIDADWYESVRTVLRQLYAKVVGHGFVVFDDYGYWQGCRRAVHEFFEEGGIDPPLTDVDGIGAYFQKPA